MKTIIALVLLAFSARAHAGTVTIQPGQCIMIGSTNVCAASNNVATNQPYYPNEQHQPRHQTITIETAQEVAPYAYCTLTENKAPNTWDLYRQGGNSKHRMNQFVKSFAHFESSACQAEADRINQRS